MLSDGLYNLFATLNKLSGATDRLLRLSVGLSLLPLGVAFRLSRLLASQLLDDGLFMGLTRVFIRNCEGIADREQLLELLNLLIR